MSYILEALRRAETERQRGQVPGLHDAGLGLAAAAPAPARSAAPMGWALLVLLVLVLAAGAAWWWPQPAPPVLAQAPVAVAPAPVEPPATMPAPLPVVVSAPPTPAPAVPAAPAVAEKPMRFGDLPADEQRQLPALVPSGSVWSEQASARFVILNGQITREGDTVAPDLVLERIQPKAAWLRWRGRLIELPL